MNILLIYVDFMFLGVRMRNWVNFEPKSQNELLITSSPPHRFFSIPNFQVEICVILFSLYMYMFIYEVQSINFDISKLSLFRQEKIALSILLILINFDILHDIKKIYCQMFNISNSFFNNYYFFINISLTR